MTKDFKYGQTVLPIDHKFPKTTIKKPSYDHKLLFDLDKQTHALSVHIIAMFYKDNVKKEGTEIDIIQIGIFNTPQKSMLELMEDELSHLLKESADVAVNYVNEQIATKYPKIERVAFYTPSQLMRLWNQWVAEKNRKDKEAGSFEKPPFGVA